MKLQTAESPNIIQHHLWILWVPHFLHYFLGGFPEIDAHQSTFPAGSFEGIASEEPATWADTAKHCWGRSSRHCKGCISSSLTNPGSDHIIWVTLWGSPVFAQPQLLRPFRLRLFEPIGSWPARACDHDLWRWEFSSTIVWSLEMSCLLLLAIYFKQLFKALTQEPLSSGWG
jgi:hypothetical protein